MADLGGGRGPPKPPGRFPRIGGPKPTARAPVPSGTSPGTGVHAPAGVHIDRAALDRMLDGRKRHAPGEDHRPEGLEKIGQEALPVEELARWSAHLIAEHAMVLLSKKRAYLERTEALAEVGDLLISLDRAKTVKRVLFQMPDAGRIVDIYPLEVLVYVQQRRPDLVPGVTFQPFVKNRADVEYGTFGIEMPIDIHVPLPMKLKMFALDGGGSPGYFLTPGPPARYALEMGDSGRFTFLLAGDMRGHRLIDRLTINVEDD